MKTNLIDQIRKMKLFHIKISTKKIINIKVTEDIFIFKY